MLAAKEIFHSVYSWYRHDQVLPLTMTPIRYFWKHYSKDPAECYENLPLCLLKMSSGSDLHPTQRANVGYQDHLGGHWD